MSIVTPGKDDLALVGHFKFVELRQDLIDDFGSSGVLEVPLQGVFFEESRVDKSLARREHNDDVAEIYRKRGARRLEKPGTLSFAAIRCLWLGSLHNRDVGSFGCLRNVASVHVPEGRPRFGAVPIVTVDKSWCTVA